MKGESAGSLILHMKVDDGEKKVEPRACVCACVFPARS